jgi:hypothetical protein
LCHHYSDAPGRINAVSRCRDRLAPGGVLVVFENVRAETDAGHALQRSRWAAYQRRHKNESEALMQLAREGTAFFPIRVSEHLALFAKLGFTEVELVWRAYAQAGFYSRK